MRSDQLKEDVGDGVFIDVLAIKSNAITSHHITSIGMCIADLIKCRSHYQWQKGNEHFVNAISQQQHSSSSRYGYNQYQ